MNYDDLMMIRQAFKTGHTNLFTILNYILPLGASFALFNFAQVLHQFALLATEVCRTFTIMTGGS